MLRQTIRRDLGWRLLAALVLVAMPLGLVLLGLVAGSDRPASNGYLALLDGSWFQLPGGCAILIPAAVLLAAAGTLMRPARDVAFLLALPTSRRRWVLTHVAAAVAGLALIVAVIALTFATVALRAGVDVPVGALLRRSLLDLAAASVWIGPTTLLMVLVRRPIVAITLAFVALAMSPVSRFLLEIPAKPTSVRLPAWDPWAFADPRAWSGGIPLASVASALVLGVSSTLAAVWLFERLDL